MQSFDEPQSRHRDGQGAGFKDSGKDLMRAKLNASTNQEEVADFTVVASLGSDADADVKSSFDPLADVVDPAAFKKLNKNKKLLKARARALCAALPCKIGAMDLSAQARLLKDQVTAMLRMKVAATSQVAKAELAVRIQDNIVLLKRLPT